MDNEKLVWLDIASVVIFHTFKLRGAYIFAKLFL